MLHSLITLTARLAFVAGLLHSPIPTHPALGVTVVTDTWVDVVDATITLAPTADRVVTNDGYMGQLDPQQSFTFRLGADYRVLTCWGSFGSADGLHPGTVPASSLSPEWTAADAFIAAGTCTVKVPT